MRNPTDKFLSLIPYIRGKFGNDDVQKINDRFEVFNNTSLNKEKQVQRLSTVNSYDYTMANGMGGGQIAVAYYQQLLYGASSDDKKRRIDDYRSMANFAEVERALKEICKEFFVKDDEGNTMKFKLRGNYNSEVESLLSEEFYSFLEIFKLDEKGRKMIWDWLVEGELFFENIISMKKPELGILGLRRIAAERCDPLYYDLDNELIDSFILRNKTHDMYPFQIGKMTAQASYGANDSKQILFLNDKQVSYIANDQWADGKKYKIPVLAHANRPYRQLSLIEDATIIYMIVRAPERLVFNVDVGGMMPSQSEQYIKRLMGQYWSRKTIDNQGRIENMYEPQGMLENYWFPVTKDGRGTKVESIGGGSASPDNLEILNFFVQKLYMSLKVPLARLNSDTQFSDGDAITREELTFAQHIIDIQKLWASAIKQTFIVHLKLKGKKILECAKKLNVDDVIKTDKKGVQTSIKLADIFRESEFNNHCWNNLDILDTTINEKIDVLIEQEENRYNFLIEQLEEYEKNLADIKNDIIFESEELNKDMILENISIIYSEIDNIEKNNNELKNIKNDMTSWWEQYDLKEEDLDMKFVEPSQFFALRQQQMHQIKSDNFNNMSQNDMISTTLAQKLWLGWDDKKILANREFLLRDAAFRWELAQVEQNGPDFREKALEEIQNATGEGGGMPSGAVSGGGGGPSLPSPGGAGGASGGGSDTNLPSFGEPIESEAGVDSGEDTGSNEGGDEEPAPSP